ncbi:sensor histidine kinase [Arsukibacterium tuosuense]|uniref:sensor histidine kinase n=1 Tax=Arsukibacterium tuosuense TaxID=1323745 RepID=UPI001482F7B0|nr:sensor histidine kinase [Arsukibacterium tuosuense]
MAHRFLTSFVLLLICSATGLLLTAAPGVASTNSDNTRDYFPPASEFFVSITDRQHIPDNIVTKLAQDKYGRLWIGSAGGLIRYDGYRFRHYLQSGQQQQSNSQSTAPIAGNFVRDLLQTSDGTLWLATAPGGIQRYESASDSFYQPKITAPGIADDFGYQVQAITEDPKGNIWLAGNQGLALLDHDSQVLQFVPPQPELQDVRALLTDERGNLWIGSRSGLFLLTPGSAGPQQIKGAATELGQVLTLARVANQIWLGTDRAGAFVINPNHSLTALPQNLTSGRVSGPVYDILQISDDEVWLAGFAGINRLAVSDKSVLGHYQHDISNPYSLAHQDVRTLLKDSAGKIWLGGYGGGLQRFDGQAGVSTLRRSLADNTSISSGDISSILELADGQLWLGSRGNGIDVIDPARGIVERHQPQADVPGKLQHGWITAMAEQADGTIWLGVNPGQLYRFFPQSGQFTLLGPEQGIWRTNVRSLFVDSQQRLWLGSSTGLALWQEQQQRFVRIKQDDGEPLQDYINAIVEDQHRNIWLGTGASGLYLIEPAAVTTPAAKAVPTDQITSILGLLHDNQNRLWLDTPTGLYQFNYQQYLQQHTAKATVADINAALTKVVFANSSLNEDFGANLLDDDQGNIWTGKFHYNPGNGQLYQLTPADGVDIGSPWYRSYYKTRQGLLLFGGTSGLLVINPAKFSPWQYQPEVLLSELKVQGRSRQIAPDQQTLTLNAAERSFSVEFGAMDLSAPQQLQYRYRLEGFDEDWQFSDASQRIASYTNLWPGNYRLQIQATNRTGHWSGQQTELQLTVMPAFWQQWWFALLLALSLILAIYLLVKVRTRVAQLQARELARQVEERSQQLKLAQQSLLENEKMAALGQTVAGVAHEINTPVGVSITASSALAGKLAELKQHFADKTLSSKAFSQFVADSEQHLQLISYNLQRAADLVTQFKQLAVNETVTDTVDIKLKPWLQHLVARLNPPNAAIGIVLQCPDNLTLKLRASALATVLSHLLENALLHAFEPDDSGEIKLDVRYSNQQLILKVSDNGKGIDQSVQNIVFNPFVTTRRASQSKGLGLHLCYNLVTQVLQGSIEMQTTACKGTTFKLTLPLSADNKAS